MVSTDAEVKDYISSIYLSTASSADVDHLLDLYTDDITKGSPYSTGILNAITPQFKRLAALQGDVVFQAPRRFFLKNRADKQNAWSFCASCPFVNVFCCQVIHKWLTLVQSNSEQAPEIASRARIGGSLWMIYAAGRCSPPSIHQRSTPQTS